MALGDADRATAWCLAAAALALFLGLASQTTFADPDMFHELSLARDIVAQRAVPQGDGFAFTETRTSTVHHEWGFGLLLFGALRACGPVGIVLLRYVALITLFLGALHLARRRGASVSALAIVALPAIVMAHYVDLGTLRAQTVTLTMALATLGLIERDRGGDRRWAWVWFPMLLVWQNLHGGFVVGIGLLILHAAEQALRRAPVRHLVWIVLLSIALMPLQPWGFDYPRYLARAITMERAEIIEWRSIAGAWWPILVCFLATLVAAAFALRRRVAAGGLGNTSGVLIAIAVAALAIRHQRHLSLYALVLVTQITPWFASAEKDRHRAAPRRAFLIRYAAAIVAVAFFGLFIEGAPHRLIVPANPGDHPRLLYPTGAVDFLARHRVHGRIIRVMTPFVVGAYVSWRLHPEVLVSLDGRYEVAYADGVLEDHLEFYRAQPFWRRVLEQVDPDVVLIRRSAKIADAMMASDEMAAEWPVVYQDDAYLLRSKIDLGGAPEDRRGARLSTAFPTRADGP